MSEPDGAEGERESSVMSEYDGAGVDRREYFDRVCAGVDDSMAERSCRL
jgi:hypothetical protein